MQRFLFLVFFNAAVPLLQSEEDTARLRGGGKRECGCGEEEARTEGGEGGRQRSIYADSLRRSSADPVMMRDETAEVLDKEERNESKVQRSGLLLNTQRTTETGGGDQPNSDEDFSLRVDQYLISLI